MWDDVGTGLGAYGERYLMTGYLELVGPLRLLLAGIVTVFAL